MAKSANANPNNCFSGILRRLLCSGSFPTHPSDQFGELNIKKLSEKSPKHATGAKEEAASTPGVVARLMGLDSFPSTPRTTTLGSYFRSRSVNSIDFLAHFDPIIQRHRRVRSSVSFREDVNADAILRLVDEAAESNRKIVNVEKLQENRVDGNKPSKKEEEIGASGCAELSSGIGNRTLQKMEFHGRRRQSLKERKQIVKTVSYKEEDQARGSNCLKKKRNNSGCRLKKVHPEGTVQEVVPSRNKQQSQIGKCESPCSINAANSHNREVRAITRGKNIRKMKNKESCYYKRMGEEICRVADEDVKENWTDRIVFKFEDLEDICHQFGQEILGVLLKQFVDELVLLHHHEIRTTY